MKQYWLLKQEPDVFSWEDLCKDGNAIWDGVRNYQARNNLQKMKLEDYAFFYHSVSEKRIVGIAKVTATAFQDPTTEDPRWVAVEITPVKSLHNPVSLLTIKSIPELAELPLIRHTRLSVMPVTENEFKKILDLSQTKLNMP